MDASATHPDRTEQATLGGGCFWCLDAAYRKVAGVTDVTSGYAGGHLEHPSYKDVTRGDTGHAEVVQVNFDVSVLSFSDVLDIFWVIHDPTTPNRQGFDVGPQYRSIILYHSEEQRRSAAESMAKAAPLFKRPIVTELVPLRHFYIAEDEHQDFYAKNPHAGYCQVVINPKLAKLRKKFSGRLKD